MKKFLLLFLTLTLAISAFAACDGSGGDESKPADDGSAPVSAPESEESKTVDLDALLAVMKERVETEEQRVRNADDIYQDTGIAADSYVSFFWLTDISGLSSEKAVIFEAKDEEAAADIKTRLDTVLQSETAQMKEYDAKNYDMLLKAVSGQKGLYVYLLVSPNVDSLAEALNGAF